MKWVRGSREHEGYTAEIHGTDSFVVVFDVEPGSRCWLAWEFVSVPSQDGGICRKIGEYRSERLAKAACRRKAGRIVDALKRGIRA